MGLVHAHLDEFYALPLLENLLLGTGYSWLLL